MWPEDAPRDGIKGWLPRMYKPGVMPPHILPRMIPASMFGVNLRELIPEAWPRMSREYRANFGNRCQVCGSGAKVECHEDWEYLFDPSARSGSGVQRLRRLASFCRNCHELKHLGKTQMRGRSEAAMNHLAFVNGWTLERAYQEADNAWADWELRNRFIWKLDVSWAEREFGVTVDAGSERIRAIQNEAAKRFGRPAQVAELVPEVAALPSLSAPAPARVDPLPAPSYPVHQVPWAGEGGSGDGAGGLIVSALLGCCLVGICLAVWPWFRKVVAAPSSMIIAILAIVTVILAFASRRFRWLLLIGVLVALLGAGLRGLYRASMGKGAGLKVLNHQRR